MSPQDREEEDALWEDVADYAVGSVRGFLKSLVDFGQAPIIALAAMWLSHLQHYADYPEWLVGLTVFVTLVSHRFRWVGKVLILWLLVLTLVRLWP